MATVSAKQITRKQAESRLFEHVVAKRIVRVPQLRYLLAIKGTQPVLQKTGWRGKPGAPFSFSYASLQLRCLWYLAAKENAVWAHH
jgi:hypothetical protein